MRKAGYEFVNQQYSRGVLVPGMTEEVSGYFSSWTQYMLAKTGKVSAKANLGTNLITGGILGWAASKWFGGGLVASAD